MWTWTSRRLSTNCLLDIVFAFGAAEIGFAHTLIAGNLVRAAGREDSALRHHGDVVGNFKHEAHVVFYDDDIDFARQWPDLGDRTFGLGRAHAAGRLVEQ